MKKAYVWIAIILVLASCVALGLGVNKLVVYDKGSKYPYKTQNAYVEGDAYNYIINAGQTTAYFVLAAGGTLSAFLLIACGHLNEIRKASSQNLELLTKVTEKQEESKSITSSANSGFASESVDTKSIS